MDETLEERLSAVERALTDGDHDCSSLADGAATADRVESLESDVSDLVDRVAELEAATQALRGYVGNVRAVNTDVEQRAEAALSKAEAAQRVARTDASSGTAADGEQPSIRQKPGRDTGPARTAPDRPAERHTAPDRCEQCDTPLEVGGDSGPITARMEAREASQATDEVGPFGEGAEPTETQLDGAESTEGTRRGSDTRADVSGRSRLEELAETRFDGEPGRSGQDGPGEFRTTSDAPETDGGRPPAEEPRPGLLTRIRDMV